MTARNRRAVSTVRRCRLAVRFSLPIARARLPAHRATGEVPIRTRPCHASHSAHCKPRGETGGSVPCPGVVRVSKPGGRKMHRIDFDGHVHCFLPFHSPAYAAAAMFHESLSDCPLLSRQGNAVETQSNAATRLPSRQCRPRQCVARRPRPASMRSAPHACEPMRAHRHNRPCPVRRSFPSGRHAGVKQDRSRSTAIHATND